MKACKECAVDFGRIDYIFWPHYFDSYSVDGLEVPAFQVEFCPSCGLELLDVRLVVVEDDGELNQGDKVLVTLDDDDDDNEVTDERSEFDMTIHKGTETSAGPPGGKVDEAKELPSSDTEPMVGCPECGKEYPMPSFIDIGYKLECCDKVLVECTDDTEGTGNETDTVSVIGEDAGTDSEDEAETPEIVSNESELAAEDEGKENVIIEVPLQFVKRGTRPEELPVFLQFVDEAAADRFINLILERFEDD